MRFLIDMLLPGSRALKMWKACRNQEAHGRFQASRRHCAVVYLLCLGHLSFAASAARHPSHYSKRRAPTLHFPGISHQETADAKAKQHYCPCKTVGILQIWTFMWTEIPDLCSKNAISITKFSILLKNPIVETSISINSFPAIKLKIKSEAGIASGLHWQVDRWMITFISQKSEYGNLSIPHECVCQRCSALHKLFASPLKDQ